MSETPIFTQLLAEFHRAGKTPVGKWYFSVKPRGTIGFLSSTSQGVQPLYSPFYLRSVNID